MSGDSALRDEKRLAIVRWASKYTTRFDQDITNAWPDLANRLEAGIASLSWSELAFGPGKDFQQRCLDPAVERWQERHIQPLIQEALHDLTVIFADKPSGLAPDDARPAFDAQGQLEKLDVLKLLSLPGGVIIASSAVLVAIVTTTKLLVFTTVIVYWPLLIGGLLVGGALSLFGVYNLGRLKDDLRDRFRKHLLPHFEEAIVGKGIAYKRKHIPSVREQLVRKIQEIADSARKALDEKG